MARLGLLCIATLALVLVTSAAPCHDKGQVATSDPTDNLEYLDNDIGNFESDDDLGESDDEFDADDLAGGLDPSELDEPPYLDDGNDFGENYPEDDGFGPEDDGFGPEDDGFGPEDDGFGPDDGFDPDCPEGLDEPPYDDEFGGPGRGSGGKGSLINIEAGHIGTGDIDASGIAEDALGLDLNLQRNLQDLTVG